LVAMNISTPAHVLEAMLEANEAHQGILLCLLRNPDLPSDLLSNAIMRELGRADEGGRMPLENFMTSHDAQSRLCKLPVGTLVALSQSAEVFVRRKMATNPLLPTARLILMSRDSDNGVVDSLASNPTVQMAVDTLSCLLVRSGVGRNKRPIAEISGS